MNTPIEPPTNRNLPIWQGYAIDYLREQLRDAAPGELSNPRLFERSPLDGEGATAVFEFVADVGGRGTERHFVVVGQTEPNYYPAYGLDADEAFSLHLGTRFMLVMGVAQCDPNEPGHYDAAGDAKAIVERIAHGVTVEDVTVAAMFDVDGGRHAVLRCKLAGEPVYIFGGDAPPGFSRRVDLPHQVAYRLHLGHVLRREPAPSDED
jgi:hypothetical protein